MKRKAVAVVVVLALAALCVVAPANVSAQPRQRRVGQPPATQTPAPPPTAPRTNEQAPPARRTTPQGARANEEVSEEVGEDEVVRVNTALVTIPVSIMDRDGRFISGLRKEEFRILEDGVEQQVAYFATVEVPFTVALVLDTSASTRFKLEDIQSAAIAFLDQLGPEDRVLVLSFDDDVRVLAEATSDRRILRNAIRQTRPGRGTRLYDAVDFVIKRRFDRVQGRKALVLFTDGVDTTSKHASLRGNLADAEELDALVYPIQYDTFNDNGGGNSGGGWPGGGGRRTGGIGDILADIIIGTGGRRGGGGGAGAGAARALRARSTGARATTCGRWPPSRAAATTRPTTSVTSNKPSPTSPTSCAASTASATTPRASPARPSAARSRCASSAPTSSSARATATSTSPPAPPPARPRRATTSSSAPPQSCAADSSTPPAAGRWRTEPAGSD